MPSFPALITIVSAQQPGQGHPCPRVTVGAFSPSRVPAGAGPHPLERAAGAALRRWPLRRCHHHSPALGCHCLPPVHLRAGARGHHPPAPAGRRGWLAGARSYRCHCHRLPPGYLCACGLGRHHAEKVLCLLNSIKDTSHNRTAAQATAPGRLSFAALRNDAK
ncbi:hypothetical protein llap_16683 [Limosa lapponica baueri]|uniref:Uncharacterized protein n=1 Tax=Limosa lapponica baueri TaxID=1758121 RepID=A0A2I0TGT7_LIMLA|nr:hypothetical protein llap_16683 [Limosa lapponica baueri]